MVCKKCKQATLETLCRTCRAEIREKLMKARPIVTPIKLIDVTGMTKEQLFSLLEKQNG